MRPSEASARVVLAGLAFESISVKNGIGPKIGRGANSIGAAAARAAGVIVDSNGRMRCPAIGNTSGEFTDITQSNCILESPVEVARSARKLGDIPNAMRRLRNLAPRYKATKTTKRSANDPTGDSASTYWAGRLGNGLPIEAVPDADLWDSIQTSVANGDNRFEMQLLNDDGVDNLGVNVASGINETYLVTDTKANKQMFFKKNGDFMTGESPQAELMANVVASEVGLPVGEFRVANDGKSNTEIVVMQNHVGEYVRGSLINAESDSATHFDVEASVGPNAKFDVDNLTAMIMYDWVISNGDRGGPGNMFITKDDSGKHHVVPIDHGFALDPFYHTASDRSDFLSWATHEETAGQPPAGLAHVLADQEMAGFATREEILDAFDGAKARFKALDADAIDKEVWDALPDDYSIADIDNPGTEVSFAKREMLRERLDIVSATTREEFSSMLDRIQSGEADRAGDTFLEADVVYDSPGVTVPYDKSVIGLDEWGHNARQKSGLMVRGIPLNYNDLQKDRPLYAVSTGIDDGVRGRGSVEVTDSGLSSGYVSLLESPDSANRKLNDFQLFSDVAKAWEADDFDTAWDLLEKQAKRDGFEFATEDAARVMWDSGSPTKMVNIFFQGRSQPLENGGAAIDRPSGLQFWDHEGFVAAADWPKVKIATVRPDDLDGKSMLTRSGGELRIYGDVPHKSVRSTAFNFKKKRGSNFDEDGNFIPIGSNLPDDLKRQLWGYDNGEYAWVADIAATYWDNDRADAAKAQFDTLGDDDLVWVFHGTTPELAAQLQESGTVSPVSREDSPLPTRGDGLYLAPSPKDAATYGDAVVGFQVRKGDMAVPPEGRDRSLRDTFFDSSSGALLPTGNAVDVKLSENADDIDINESASAVLLRNGAGNEPPIDSDNTAIGGVGEPKRRKLDIQTPDDLNPIHDVFKENDRKLMLVGGAVRDTLLGREPKDFDLATDAPPDEVIRMLERDPNLRIDLTGEDFAVVRVKTPDGNEYEIATFRTDVGEGRRPEGVELATIEEDVARRDLTMNALFYDLDSNEVVDYVGGMDDIENGVVRSVGDPNDRFREDKLRILRALRFSGRTGFDLDDDTKAAIRADSDLSGVSEERIHDELLSGLSSAIDQRKFLEQINELDDGENGLWSQIFGDLDVDTSRFNSVSDGKQSSAATLASILHGNDPDAVEVELKRRKYTNNEIADVKFLQSFESIEGDTAPKLKKDFGKRGVVADDLKRFAADAGMDDGELEAFLEFVDAPPALGSAEALEQGLKGPEIGRALEAAEVEAYNGILRRKPRVPEGSSLGDLKTVKANYPELFNENGDLVRPRRPRSYRHGFVDGANDLLEGVTSWAEVRERLRGKEVVAFDYESTDFLDAGGQGVQVGAVRMVDGEIVDRFNVYMKPDAPFDEWSDFSKNTLRGPDGSLLTAESVDEFPSSEEAHRQLLDWLGDGEFYTMGHNSLEFDDPMLERELNSAGLPPVKPAGKIDTLSLARDTIDVDDPDAVAADHKLGTLADAFGIELGEGAHTADADAEATANLLNALLDSAEERDVPVDLVEPNAAKLREEERMAELDEKLKKFDEMNDVFDEIRRDAKPTADEPENDLSFIKPGDTAAITIIAGEDPTPLEVLAAALEHYDDDDAKARAFTNDYFDEEFEEFYIAGLNPKDEVVARNRLIESTRSLATSSRYSGRDNPFVETVSIDTLAAIPSGNDLRQGTDIEALGRDLRTNGFKEPIVLRFDPRTNRVMIAEGNHRLAAAQSAGLTDAPVIVIRGNNSLLDNGDPDAGILVAGPDGRPSEEMRASEIGISSDTLIDVDDPVERQTNEILDELGL